MLSLFIIANKDENGTRYFGKLLTKSEKSLKIDGVVLTESEFPLGSGLDNTALLKKWADAHEEIEVDVTSKFWNDQSFPL